MGALALGVAVAAWGTWALMGDPSPDAPVAMSATALDWRATLFHGEQAAVTYPFQGQERRAWVTVLSDARSSAHGRRREVRFYVDRETGEYLPEAVGQAPAMIAVLVGVIVAVLAGQQLLGAGEAPGPPRRPRRRG